MSVHTSTEEPAGAAAAGNGGQVFELTTQNSSIELIPLEEGQEEEGEEEEEGRNGRSLSSSVSTSDTLIN